MKSCFILFLLMSVQLNTSGRILEKDNYVLIPGTGIYIVPPEAFYLSELFPGLQHPSGTTIIVAPYSSSGFLEQINQETAKNSWDKILSREKLNTKEGEGFLIRKEKIVDGNKNEHWIFFLNYSSGCAKLEIRFPDDSDPALVASIKKSLTTIIYKF